MAKDFACIQAKPGNSSHCAAIMNIDQRCSASPMSLTEVRAKLSRRGHVGMIAIDSKSRPVGYTIYELLPDEIAIRYLVVAPECRLKRVATGLFGLISDELDDRRQEVTALVPLENLDALAFFRALNGGVCDGGFGKFRLVPEDVVRFSFAPCLAEIPD